MCDKRTWADAMGLGSLQHEEGGARGLVQLLAGWRNAFVGVILALAPGAAFADSWDAYVTFPVANVPNVQGVAAIIKDVSAASGGSLSVRLHLGGSMPINVTNITQAVSQNIIQMGDDAFFEGNVPIAALLRLPMLIRTQAEFDKAAAIMRPYIEKAYARQNVVFLGQYAYPLQVPFSRKALRSLADLKGQKLRPTSPEQGELIKSFGAVVVSLGAPEVPAALDRGLIDGVVTASAVGGRVWREQLKYRYGLGIDFGNSNIIVNRDAFEALKPDVQAALRTSVAKQTRWIDDTLQADDIAWTKKFAQLGMVTTEPKAGEIEAADRAMAPYWTAWAKAKGATAQEALGRVRGALGR
jgi:TRAP-type C4-dicarboxylate transport system substrate-binding protein